MNVLFVCTYNTCRSPIAETLMDDAVGRSRGIDVKSKSAGTFVCEGDEATAQAISVMEELGLNLEKHKAQQFTPELAEWADVILAMGKEQIEHMEVIAPEYKNKMHTLMGYANGVIGEPATGEYDVSDPYDEGLDEYRACALQMKDAIDLLIQKIEDESNAQ